MKRFAIILVSLVIFLLVFAFNISFTQNQIHEESKYSIERPTDLTTKKKWDFDLSPDHFTDSPEKVHKYSVRQKSQIYY